MPGGKQTLAGIALVALIILATVLVVRGLKRAAPAIPADVIGQQIEKVDRETLELVTLPLGEWQNLGEKERRHKNPETGKYNMVNPMTCAACGKKIPPPEYSGAMSPEEVAKATSNYTCPRCGRSAYQ